MAATALPAYRPRRGAWPGSRLTPVPRVRPITPARTPASPFALGNATQADLDRVGWGKRSPAMLSGPSAGSFNPDSTYNPPSSSAYSLDSDPLLQRILAAGAQSRANAEAEAANARKELAIQLGDPDFARAAGLDQATADAAGSNPYSTLANLRYANKQQVRATNEDTNKRNLFYGSEAGRELGVLARDLGLKSDQAYTQARSGLAAIAAALLAAEQNAELSNAQALSDAAARAAANPATYPVSTIGSPVGTVGDPLSVLTSLGTPIVKRKPPKAALPYAFRSTGRPF